MDLKRQREAELKKVYNILFQQPLTMKEAFVKTGVLRENICWHIRELRLSNRVFFVRKRSCSITKRCVKNSLLIQSLNLMTDNVN